MDFLVIGVAPGIGVGYFGGMDWSQYESPLSRAKRLTQREVDRGNLKSWVMGDYDARDRHLSAIDRRAEFEVIDGGVRLIKSSSTL